MTGLLACSQGAHRGRLRGSEAVFQGERLHLQRKLLGQEMHPHSLYQPYVARHRLPVQRAGQSAIVSLLKKDFLLWRVRPSGGVDCAEESH